MSIPIGLTTSISIVFCLIPSVPYTFSQDCFTGVQNVQVSVEPKAIYSRNESATIRIRSIDPDIVYNITIMFNDEQGNIIFCSDSTPLIKVDNILLIECETASFGAFKNNSTLYLTTTIACNDNSHTSIKHSLGTVIADPDFESVYPLNLILKHTNRIFLRLASVFPSINASFDIDLGNNETCFGKQVDLLVVFDCYFNQSISELQINMNGFPWESRIVEFVPRPEIIKVTGSTFENAFIPICFIGRNISSFYEPVLYTQFSNQSNQCNFTNIITMCCIAALGLDPIDEALDIQAQIYSHSYPLTSVTIRQALVPVLTHTEFSFKRNDLTIDLQNYETYYSHYTHIYIFDSVRQFMVDCDLKEVTSNTIHCTPRSKISFSQRNSDYVLINISQWSTVYPRIDSFHEETLTAFQLIMILVASLIFIMLISWLFIMIYYGCFDSTDAIRIIPNSIFRRSRKEKRPKERIV